MFGLTFEKLLVVLVLAAVIIGPHRLPRYAQRLGAFLRAVRGFVEATRARVETEVGTTLAVDEWRSLDPRQYDPRRIVREALAAPDARPSGSAPADAGIETSPSGSSDSSLEAAARRAPAGLSPATAGAADRERANRIASLSPGGWRPPVADRDPL